MTTNKDALDWINHQVLNRTDIKDLPDDMTVAVTISRLKQIRNTLQTQADLVEALREIKIEKLNEDVVLINKFIMLALLKDFLKERELEAFYNAKKCMETIKNVVEKALARAEVE